MADRSDEETNRKTGLAYAAALSLFAAVVAGLIIGWLLDRWLGTNPVFTLIGLAVGIAAGARDFFRVIKRWQSEERDER